MEGQGKRLLLAVALALGVMLVWNMLFPAKKDDTAQKSAAGSGHALVPAAPQIGGPAAGPAVTATPTATTGSGDAGSGSSAPAPAAATTPVVEQARGPEQKITLGFPGKLTATFSSYGGALVSWKLADERYLRDASKGELLASSPGRGAFYVDFSAGSTYFLPRDAEWVGTKISDVEVTQARNLDVKGLPVRWRWTDLDA